MTLLAEIIWLAAMLVAGAMWVGRDSVEFQRFAALDDSLARQGTYGRWIATSFALLTFASLVSLWLAGGLSPFEPFPQPFRPLTQMFQMPDRPNSPEFMIGVAIGICLNILLFVLLQRWLSRKRAAQADAKAPDAIDALIPRNRREALYDIALSVNAGFSEELFFRLALPLLLFDVTGSLLLAFAFSAVCFGLAHAYQGLRGVLATMIAGVILTLVYLRTGSLLHVMMVHAGIDLVALFVRPQLARLAGRGRLLSGAGKAA